MSVVNNLKCATLHHSNSITGPTITNLQNQISDRALLSQIVFKNSKILRVQENSTNEGEFASIAAAVDSITDSSLENTYAIYVGPGTFYEPQINVPVGVSIVGSSINSTIVTAIGDNDLFIMNMLVELSFMTIQGVPLGRRAIVCDDTGDFSQCHKLSIYDCDTVCYVRSVTQDTNMYIEYVDIDGTYTNGLVVESTNGFIAKLNVENFYAFPTENVLLQNHILATGSNYNIDVLVGNIFGLGTETAINVSGAGNLTVSSYQINTCKNAIIADNGCNINLNSPVFHECEFAVLIGPNGSPPKLDVAGAVFNNCTRNIQINNLNTTGAIVATSEYEKTFINATTPCNIRDKSSNTIKVGISGSDFTSIATALTYVNSQFLITSDQTTTIVSDGLFDPTLTFLTVTGAGLPDNTTATYINDSTVLLSNATTIAGEVTVTFIRANPFNQYTIFLQGETFLEPELILPEYVTISCKSYTRAAIKPNGVITNQIILNTGCTIESIIFDNDITTFKITGGARNIIINDCIIANSNEVFNINSADIPLDKLLIKNCDILACTSLGTIDATVATCGTNSQYIIIQNTSMLSTNGLTINGPNLDLVSTNSSYETAEGSTAIGITVGDGSKCEFTNCIFERWHTAIASSITGAGPELHLNSLVFNNCQRNLQLNNTNTTGFLFGNADNTKVYIDPSSTFEVAGKQKNTISVAISGGDYTNINDAIQNINPKILCNITTDSTVITSNGMFTPNLNGLIVSGFGILNNTTVVTFVNNSTLNISQAATDTSAQLLTFTQATITNTYVINISPGTYTEPAFIMPGYVTLLGADNSLVVLIPEDPMVTFITMNKQSIIDSITIKNVTDATAIVVDSVPSNLNISNTNFENCKIAVSEVSTTGLCLLVMNDCTIRGTFDFGIIIDGTVATSAGAAQAALTNISYLSSNSNSVGLKTKGPYAASFHSNAIFEGLTTNVNGVELSDGALLVLQGGAFVFVDTAVHVINDGSDPELRLNATTMYQTQTWDILIEHPGTKGAIQSVATGAKMQINSSAPIAINYTDPSNNTTTITGSLRLGDSFNEVADVSDLLKESPTMGVLSGGTLSADGLTLNVTEGFGYVHNSSLYKVVWENSSILLSANSTLYIYFTHLGVLTANISESSSTSTVKLGRVRTGASAIELIDESLTDALHASNKIDTMIADTFKAIFVSGSIVTVNSSLQIAVTGGKYYNGVNVVTPSGHSAPTSFIAYYRNGSSFTTVSQTTIDNLQYDNNSGLTAVTAGYYTVHSLYLVGQGVNEQYLLVYSQNQYEDLSTATAASLPTPPTYFTGGVVIIASIIVHQAVNTFSTVINQRPVPGFSASSISGTLVHGALLGLDADDHPQYLRTDGTRTLTGNLNMGNFNISNATLVNGINISSHASRHAPGGTDALSTASPAIILGSTVSPSEGTATSFSRSDHIHSIDQSTLDRNIIGGALALSVSKGGTGAATFTSGTFLVGNGTSAVSATKVVPSGTVLGTSDVQTLTNKTIKDDTNIVLGFTKSNLIAVVDTLGNDSTAAIGRLPFKTIAAAITAIGVQTGIVILVNPGSYTETALTIPTGNLLYGVGVTFNPVVTTTTTIITLAGTAKMRGIKIDMTSIVAGITLTGVVINPLCSLIDCEINVTNTTTGNATIYATRCTTTGAGNIDESYTFDRSIINAKAAAATSGTIRALSIESACTISAKNTSFTSSTIAIETTNVSSNFTLYGGNVRGGTSDTLQTAGSLQLFGSVASSGNTVVKQLQIGKTTFTSGANANSISFPDTSDTVVTLAASQTLSSKTLTAPVISTISNSGTVTIPTGTNTLATLSGTETLSGKTLTAPVISTISNSGTITLPTGTNTLATLSGLETLTNKTLTSAIAQTSFRIGSGANNTTLLPNASGGALTITLPVTTPSANKFLTSSDGSGATAWRDLSFSGDITGEETTTSVAPKWINNWSSGTSYITGNLTTYSNNVYRAKSNNSNVIPTTTATWDLVVQGQVSGYTPGSVLYAGSDTQVTQNNSTFYFDGQLLGLGVVPGSILNIAGDVSATSWTTAGKQLCLNAGTYIDTTGSGTVALRTINSIANSTLNSTNNVTITNASTLYIAGAPIASGNTAITNGYAMYIATGKNYIGGSLQIVGDYVTDSTNSLYLGSFAGNLKNGNGNVALGTSSMANYSDIGGNSYNTAVGENSLFSLVNGNNNSAIGRSSGVTLTTGSRCSLFGAFSDTSAVNTTDAIAIGYGVIAPSSTAIIGNTSVTEFRNSGDGTCSLGNASNKWGALNSTSAKIYGSNATFSANVTAPILSGNVTITLPTVTSTIATLAGTETLTNKTLTAPIISTISNTGTITLPTSGTLATLDGSETFTNKTLTAPSISTISNSGTLTLPTGTKTLATLTGTETLSGKTLTAPIISTISNTGTITLPTITSTLATLDGSETFTNKTLTAPSISTISNSGVLTLPTGTKTLATLTGTETFTNKTLTAPLLTTSLGASILLPIVASTLATLDGSETFTNKTLTAPSISTISNSGVLTLPTGTKTLATLTGTETFTNKTLTAPIISTISNTGTITLPTSGTLATLDGSETFTNKTLTAPSISTISNSGVLTLPTGTKTLATLTGTETFTNKTLTAPIISTISNTGTITLPTITSTLATLAGTETFTNKTLTAPLLTTSGGLAINLPTIASTLATLAGSETFTNKTLTAPIISTISNGGTITLPTSGTLATLAGTETFTNKTLTAPIISTISNGGTITLPTSGTLATLAGTETFTNKTLTAPIISTISNGGTLTLPNGTYTLATLSGAEVLANKTLTSPIISTISNGGAITLPTSGTLATLAGTETFTNKTLTTPIISTISNSGTITLPTGTNTLATLAGIETFSNKTLTAPAITGFTASSIPYIGASSIVSQNNAEFNWDNANATLRVGTTSAITQTVFNGVKSVNGFVQINVQNSNTGTLASSDLVATADTGTSTTNFINVGINSSIFSDPTWTISGALDGYLYSSNSHLTLGTASSKDIIFHTNGTLAANERMRIANDGTITVVNSIAIRNTANTDIVTLAIPTLTGSNYTITMPPADSVYGQMMFRDTSNLAWTNTWIKVSETTLSGGAAISINSVTFATFKWIRFELFIGSTSALVSPTLQLNSSATGYAYTRSDGTSNNQTGTSATNIPLRQATSTNGMQVSGIICNSTGTVRPINIEALSFGSSATTAPINNHVKGVWYNATACTSINIAVSSGTMNTTTELHVWGCN